MRYPDFFDPRPRHNEWPIFGLHFSPPGTGDWIFPPKTGVKPGMNLPPGGWYPGP